MSPATIVIVIPAVGLFIGLGIAWAVSRLSPRAIETTLPYHGKTRSHE